MLYPRSAPRCRAAAHQPCAPQSCRRHCSHRHCRPMPPRTGHQLSLRALAPAASGLRCHVPGHGNPSAQPIGALPSSADRAFAALIWSRTCTGSAPAAPPLLASKRDLRLRLEGPASAASSPATPRAALPSACASSRSAASVSAMAYMQRKHGTRPAHHTDTQRFECMHTAQAVTCRQCNMHTQRTACKAALAAMWSNGQQRCIAARLYTRTHTADTYLLHIIEQALVVRVVRLIQQQIFKLLQLFRVLRQVGLQLCSRLCHPDKLHCQSGYVRRWRKRQSKPGQHEALDKNHKAATMALDVTVQDAEVSTSQ